MKITIQKIKKKKREQGGMSPKNFPPLCARSEHTVGRLYEKFNFELCEN